MFNNENKVGRQELTDTLRIDLGLDDYIETFTIPVSSWVADGDKFKYTLKPKKEINLETQTVVGIIPDTVTTEQYQAAAIARLSFPNNKSFDIYADYKPTADIVVGLSVQAKKQ